MNIVGSISSLKTDRKDFKVKPSGKSILERHCEVKGTSLFFTGLSLLITIVVSGPVFVVLIMIGSYPSGITIRKLERCRFITYKTWK